MKDIIVNTSNILLKDITPDTEGVILAYNEDKPRFYIFFDGKDWLASMYIDRRRYSYASSSLRELVDVLLSLEFITSFKLVEL